jgi:hypothetical protein
MDAGGPPRPKSDLLLCSQPVTTPTVGNARTIRHCRIVQLQRDDDGLPVNEILSEEGKRQVGEIDRVLSQARFSVVRDKFLE